MSAPTSPTQKIRPLNICIASTDFMGPAQDNSSELACTAMAQALAAAGHAVTCLYLGTKSSTPHNWERWVEKYKGDSLTLVALPQINGSDLVAPSSLSKSYEIYHWLKKNDRFDIIHFPDRKGPGYHTLTAKYHGVAFARTTICVGLHDMTAWLKGAELKSTDNLAEIDTEFIERRAAALADALISPSQSLMEVVGACANEPAQNPLPEPKPDLANDAVRAAVQALSIDPNDAVALKALARIHLNAGLHEAAQEACILILKNNAKDAEALQLMEEALAQEARLSENLTDTSGALRHPAGGRELKPTQALPAQWPAAFA